MKKFVAITFTALLLGVGVSSLADSVSRKTIRINQLGYLPESTKIAVIPAVKSRRFKVVNADNGQLVYSGLLSKTKTWEEQGSRRFKLADFSQLKRPGKYRIQVSTLKPSNVIVIGNDIYDEVLRDALRAYYLNRSGTALSVEHAGKFARAAGHLDNAVKIHSSAASEKRPPGSTFPAPKGWYDAGDFGKYMVNSGISTYTLLAAHIHIPHAYNGLELNIPESGDAVPDILDEIMWNLDWMEAMQDPSDGGVYHKLTTLEFDGPIMPSAGVKQRYFIGKATSPTLNFAAVMATASRVYANYEAHFPGKAARYEAAAIAAWKWAEKNPAIEYKQPDDVKTGTYDDKKFSDEFAWAAAELFLLTKDSTYYDRFREINTPMQTPSWAEVGALGYVSLANEGKSALTNNQYKWISDSIVAYADTLLNRYQNSPYKVVIGGADFVWGSNAVALNNAWMLLEGYKLTGSEAFANAALAEVDYIFGRNPTGYSFVSGYGYHSPVDLHHRASYADRIKEPVPGFVVGGPHSGQQDGCKYPSKAPARSYVDDWCSYSTNEVTINWNAPLVYVLGMVSTFEKIPLNTAAQP